MSITKSGDFFNWASKKRTVSQEDIYEFRMNQKWGKKRPDDVVRRHKNLIKVMALC
jgi:hypothetical protein